jgi:hypothetical protein
MAVTASTLLLLLHLLPPVAAWAGGPPLSFEPFHREETALIYGLLGFTLGWILPSVSEAYFEADKILLAPVMGQRVKAGTGHTAMGSLQIGEVER